MLLINKLLLYKDIIKNKLRKRRIRDDYKIIKEVGFFYNGRRLKHYELVETGSYPYVRHATEDEKRKTIKYYRDLKREEFRKNLDNLKIFFRIKKRDIEKTYFSSPVFKSISVMDEQIRDKGAIVDSHGGLHSTPASYKEYLKKNDLVINDWSAGSNKKKPKLSDRREVAGIVEQYLR